jgi:hypothetical protein
MLGVLELDTQWEMMGRDDEFDLDLEDIMVMEAIWLSIQVFSHLN